MNDPAPTIGLVISMQQLISKGTEAEIEFDKPHDFIQIASTLTKACIEELTPIYEELQEAHEAGWRWPK